MKKNFKFAENFKKNEFKIHNAYKLNNTSYKVCIVLPTYQRSDLCINVIDNILKQTHVNWNLYVIDDGSEQHHVDKKKQYIENLCDGRIVFVKNVVNKKIPATLNVGLKMFLESDCEYMTWISDDNVYHDIYLDNLLLGGDFVYSAFLLKSDYYVFVDKQYSDVNDILNCFHGLGSFMWSRNAITILGNYDENLFLCEDYEYLLRTFLLIKDRKYSKVVGMEHILSEDSLTIKQNSENKKIASKIKNVYLFVTDFSKNWCNKERENLVNMIRILFEKDYCNYIECP